jgi:hypothetical protein
MSEPSTHVCTSCGKVSPVGAPVFGAWLADTKVLSTNGKPSMRLWLLCRPCLLLAAARMPGLVNFYLGEASRDDLCPR